MPFAPPTVVIRTGPPAPSATGDGRAAAGFTLIEIIACMIIFAVSFLAVAMMLPVGALLQKELLGRTDAAIVGKNSLEVIKAKGVYSGANEWMLRAGGTKTYTSPQGNWSWGGLAGCLMNTNAGAAVFPANRRDIKDMEAVATSQEWSLMASVSSATGLQEYWDTNGGGTCVLDRSNYLRPANWQYGAFLGPFSFTNGGYNNYGLGGDLTNWGNGRINCFKNRPIAGVTPSFFAPGDLSAPSSVFDVSRRSYVSYVHYSDRSTTVQAGEGQYKNYASHDWRMLATTMARPNSVDEAPWNTAVKGWPEQVEWDLKLLDQQNDADPTHTTRHRNTVTDIPSTSPHFRMSNSAGAFRWGGLPVAKKGWCGRLNSRIRDWNNMLATGVRDTGYAGWDNYALGCNYFYGFPIRDAAQTTYDWRSAYLSPVPMDVLAIVYDKQRDLLLLRFPQCFAKVRDDDGSAIPGAISGGTNPRMTGVNAGIYSTGADWVDRRLKVGDHMVTITNGYHLQVIQVLDEVAEGNNLSAARGGPIDWSDGTYQLVKVSPSLSSTMLSDNDICTYTDWPGNPEATDPYLYRVIIGTPPVTGGPNPLQSVDEIPVGGRNCGGVFRMDDDVCN